MKVFLLTVRITDGVHEHKDYALVEGTDYEDAMAFAERQVNCDGLEFNIGGYFGHNDGLTNMVIDSLQLTSAGLAQSLEDLSIAHYAQEGVGV